MGKPQPGAERLPSGEDEAVDAPLRAWRDAILNRAFRSLFVASIVGELVVLRAGLQSGDWSLALPATLAWIGFGLGTALPDLPHRTRASLFVATLMGASLSTLWRFGFVEPVSMIALATLCVVVRLYAGTRAAMWTFVLTLVCMVGIAAVFVLGDRNVPVPHAVVSNPANWFRELMVFAVITGALLSSVSFFASHLESALSRTQRLLDALSVESVQKQLALEQREDLEQQLQQSQKLEALGTLAGGVAHDFNNLLLVISSHAELIATRSHLSDADQASLTQIEQATQRASALTRQLLTFSRQRVAERAPLELNASLELSLSMIRRLLPQSVSLEVHLAPNPVYVMGAQVDIDQVLMNLCVNARDAMPDGGTLHIEVGVETDLVRLSVRDWGQGIAPEVRSRIFDPFFSTKGSNEGSGLGLSVVHGIVTKMGGNIELDSEPGAGTAFHVYWPPCPPPDEKRVEPGSQPLTARGSGLILLADDDPGVREVMETLLLDAGYRVVACADGVEARAEFERRADEVDLIVSDVVMPRLGGRALYDSLCAGGQPPVPFLFCSGYADVALTEELLAKPGCGFLQKPFSRDDLLRQIAKLLDVKPRAAVPDSTPAGTTDTLRDGPA